jgi:Putative zinc-finger
MAQMDHSDAIRLQTGVKYVLGELSPVQREEFEEHYFECAECAVDIKALATFVDTTREVLRQERANQFAKERVPARAGWLRWFHPIATVPAFAALLLIIAYQNGVTIPQLKNTPSRAVAEIYGQTFLVQPSDTRRGGEAIANEATLDVRPNESFLLQLDFTPSSTSPAYLCQLQDPSGRVLQQVRVPGEKANQELLVPVQAGLLPRPGKYSLVFLGADPFTGKAVNDDKLQYFIFNVAFRP